MKRPKLAAMMIISIAMVSACVCLAATLRASIPTLKSPHPLTPKRCNSSNTISVCPFPAASSEGRKFSTTSLPQRSTLGPLPHQAEAWSHPGALILPRGKPRYSVQPAAIGTGARLDQRFHHPRVSPAKARWSGVKPSP